MDFEQKRQLTKNGKQFPDSRALLGDTQPQYCSVLPPYNKKYMSNNSTDPARTEYSPQAAIQSIAARCTGRDDP
jgi:hypothetical protein